jgi:uncharacterized membrane protein YGL010W
VPSLAHYMEQYDHEHTSTLNKVCHGVGIPLIFAGLVALVLMKWILGAGLFVGGWVFLLVGHKIEGNHPAFFQGAVYLLVGPIWVAKELWMFLTGTQTKRAPEKTKTGQA